MRVCGVPMDVRVVARVFTCLSASLLVTSSFLVSGCGGRSKSISSQPTTVIVPVVSLAISPAAVLPGQNATLSWSASSATSCSANGAWSGVQQISGSMNVALASAATQTYFLECTSTSGQSVRQSVTLSLSPIEGAC